MARFGARRPIVTLTFRPLAPDRAGRTGSDLIPIPRVRRGTPRRQVYATGGTQIGPSGDIAGKSLSWSNTLLKKFVRENMATSATISMTCASV